MLGRYVIDVYVTEERRQRCVVYAESDDAALELVYENEKAVLENAETVEVDTVHVGGSTLVEANEDAGVSDGDRGVYNASGERIA